MPFDTVEEIAANPEGALAELNRLRRQMEVQELISNGDLSDGCPWVFGPNDPYFVKKVSREYFYNEFVLNRKTDEGWEEDGWTDGVLEEYYVLVCTDEAAHKREMERTQ